MIHPCFVPYFSALDLDIRLLSIEPRTAGEDEDALSIITLGIYSLFKFCQDEADRLINQIVMNINFTYNIAALHYA